VPTTKAAADWKAWGQTDPGRNRRNNEDRILCDPDTGIFVVADGMGGEAAGEVAAQQAIDFIGTRLSSQTGTAARRLREAIAGANNEIYRLASQNPEWRGMACVLTAAIVENGTLHVGHVGDSRLYRIQNNAIRKLTPDHSPVGQKEDSGELAELEAMRHPRRNEVFRDVGSQPHKPDDPEFVEYLQFPFDRDAAYVFCSDGLSDMLSSREILGAMTEHAGRPQDAVRSLIEKANSAGGKDNISVIVLEGGDFAASKKGNGTTRGRPHFSPGMLRGRWAFLIYGILLGLLAFYAWSRLVSPEVVTPAVPSVETPAVLHVAPASSEYSSISKALEAAHDGDRIEVADGEYEEVLKLKEGVDIFAKSPGMAVLRLTRALPNAVAAILADGLKRAGVMGLTVRAEPAAALPVGIRISNSNVNIVGVEVSGALRAGVLVDGNSGSFIAGCYVHGNAGAGIVTSGTSTPSMTGNLIYANGISRTQTAPGLYVTGSSVPEVKRNTFSGNGAEAIRLQKQELKVRMMDNLFINSRKTVLVERVRP
jgi:PPM family protein phosphatase